MSAERVMIFAAMEPLMHISTLQAAYELQRPTISLEGPDTARTTLTLDRA